MGRALALWWRDRSARDLLAGADGITFPLFDADSLNSLSPRPERTDSAPRPGDLAVTTDGVHVFAHLGEGRWIEADPELRAVVVVSPPAPENPWFDRPVRIVRLQELAGPDDPPR